jgi:mRNA-degrading endonuclease toxin of MazEF toxin-antitoxin module
MGRDESASLNLDHVDTVAKGFIGDRITTLSPEKLHSVCHTLEVATDWG